MGLQADVRLLAGRARSSLLTIVLAVLSLTLQGCGPAAKTTTAFSSPTTTTTTFSVPGGGRMACGAGVELCGVLSLETGLGHGAYSHPAPTVHGLWPETGSFGSSTCKQPASTAPPDQVYPCYKQSGQTDAQLLGFEKHEWYKHGICSGAASAADFFGQVCTISGPPLRVMADARNQNSGTDAIAQALRAAGYPLWDVCEETGEVRLSTCAGKDGRWKIAAVTDFPKVCGGGAPLPPSPTPPPATSCVPGKHGPACHTNGDCVGRHGCLRCAKSGFCTDQPLEGMSETFLNA